MPPFVLPLALVCWTVISLWAAHRIGEWSADRGEPNGLARGLRLELKALALLVLLPLPLIDELLAKPQFDALCREQAADRGATTLPPGIGPQQRVRRQVLPPEPLPGLMLPVSQRKHLYIDEATHQTLASVNSFEAHAGKLGRLMGLSEAPLTFRGRCEPLSPPRLAPDRPSPGPIGPGHGSLWPRPTA